MALTDAQKQECMLLLGLPARVDVTFALEGEVEALQRAEIALVALGQANATQETKIIAILAQYTALEYDTDLIDAEGLDSSPMRTRSRLRRMLSDVLGLAQSVGMPSIRLQRG